MSYTEDEIKAAAAAIDDGHFYVYEIGGGHWDGINDALARTVLDAVASSIAGRACCINCSTENCGQAECARCAPDNENEEIARALGPSQARAMALADPPYHPTARELLQGSEVPDGPPITGKVRRAENVRRIERD